MNEFLAVLVSPVGTSDETFFLQEIKRYMPALETKIHFLSCDQSKDDILKNYTRIKQLDPKHVILGESMQDETIEDYFSLFYGDRPKIRSTAAAKPIVVYYGDNGIHCNPEKALSGSYDDYCRSPKEVITYLTSNR